jgi:3',5'-cyclic AMP phosphodiesterase CpdA
VNAVVRTVNRVHKDAPLDFVLLGGDSADNAQQNEFDWVLSILNGSTTAIACDSGDPNDPIPGPDNDGKDPFIPAGLDVPWYWVTGNHDVLAQGNYPTDAYRNSLSTGAAAIGGTRDYRQRGAVTSGDVTPDPKRALVTRADMVARVVANAGKAGPAAHGLGAYAMQTKKAYYTADLPNNVRLLAMDTAAETGASEGVLRRGDLDTFIKPEIARAKSDGKLVIVASHHAAGSLGDGTGLGGAKQADAVTQQEWEQVLVAAPHVIAHVAGHSHEQRIRFVGTPGVAGYWEVKTSAIADYPHQFRTIEVWDEDDGQISIRAVSVDYATDGDAVATSGRELGLVDWTSGWVSGDRLGTLNDRNVALWLKKP